MSNIDYENEISLIKEKIRTIAPEITDELLKLLYEYIMLEIGSMFDERD